MLREHCPNNMVFFTSCHIFANTRMVLLYSFSYQTDISFKYSISIPPTHTEHYTVMNKLRRYIPVHGHIYNILQLWLPVYRQDPPLLLPTNSIHTVSGLILLMTTMIPVTIPTLHQE